MTRLRIYWAVFLATSWACVEQPPASDAEMRVASDVESGIAEMDDSLLWTRAVSVVETPTVEIGSGAVGPEYELFRVRGAVRLSDGRIVVANGGTGELRWYSPEGVYLSSSGRQGQGPGEFQAIQGVIGLPGDSLLVVDVRLRRYSIIAPDGAFIRTVQVDGRIDAPLPIARFEDQSMLMAPAGVMALRADGPPRIERIPLEVLRFQEGGTGPEPLGTFPGLEVSIGPSGGIRPDGSMPIGRGARPFGRNTIVAGDLNGWVIGDTGDPRFEIRAPGGEIIAVVEWQHGERRVTPEDLSAHRAPSLARQPDAPARNRLLGAWAEHPDPPETMPAFSGLLIDQLGNVWVSEYSPSFERDPNRFRVFDRAGTPLGAVVGPAGVEVLGVGDDWMLGVRRDALGVEAVVLFGLQAPWS